MARELIPKLFETSRQDGIGCCLDRRSCADDEVDRGKPPQLRSKRFSNDPLDPISIYRITRRLGGNRKSDPRVRQ